MTNRTIRLEVEVDSKGAVRDIRGVSRAADEASGNLDRTSRSSRTLTQNLQGLGRVATRAGAVLGTAIAGATAASIKLGIDAEETAAKFRTVFRGSVEETTAALNDLAAAQVLTQSELQASASSVQDLLVPLGLARDEAAKLSVEAVSLAGDLASFNNVNTQTVIEGIQSALAGSSEPLRRYGIDVRETRLQTLAYEQGLADLGEELTQAQRGQAVFAAITADSADAIGDLDRTSDSTANQLRALGRDFRQAGEDVGTALLPAVNILVTELRGVDGEAGPLTETITDLASGLLRLAEFGIVTADAFGVLGIRIGQTLATAQQFTESARDNFGISDLVVPLKAYFSAADAFGQATDNSAEIAAEAEEDIQSLRDRFDELIGPIIQARLELGRTADEAEETGEAADDAGDGAEGLARSLNNAGQAYRDTVDEVEGAKESTFDFRSEIEDLRAEIEGPAAQAALAYQRQLEDYNEQLASSAITQSEYMELVQATAVLFERDQAAALRSATQEYQRFADVLANQVFQVLPPFIQQLESIRDLLGVDGDRPAGGDEGSFIGDLTNTLGDSLGGSLQAGQGLSDSIGTSLVEFGSAPISDAIGSVLSDAFKNVENDPELQDAIAGFSVVVGEAIQGNAGSAAGAAVGAIVGTVVPVIGTALGATIGSAIGGLFDGEDTPAFRVAGENQGIEGGGFRLGGDELAQTALGDLRLGFKNIEDATQRELESLLISFGAEIASVVRDTDAIDIISDAIRDVDFRSGEDGASPGAVIDAVFREIVESLEGGIRLFVERGRDQADQLDRFATLFQIERQLATSFGFGLGGDQGRLFADPDVEPSPGAGGVIPGFSEDLEDGLEPVRPALRNLSDDAGEASTELLKTAELLEDLKLGTESLVETFDRLLGALRGLDRASNLTESSLQGTREEQVRFAAALLEFFGDDAEVLNESLGRIFETFFTDQERALEAIETSRRQASDLLSRIGVDATDDILSESGFRDLFDSLFGTLNAEDTAILINAGNAVANVIEAENELADARGQTIVDAERLAELQTETAEILNPLAAEFAELRSSIEGNVQAAAELSGAEDALATVRANSLARLGDFLFSATESLLENTIAILERDEDVTQQQLGNIDRISRASGNRYASEVSALENIAQLIDDLLIGDLSPLTPLDREAEARSQLEELFAAAEGGDVDALEELPSAVQDFLQILQENTGGVGRFEDEFNSIIDRLEDIEGAGPQTSPPTSQDLQAINATNTAGFQQVDDGLDELRLSLQLLREEQQNLELLQQFGAIADALDESPSELAERLGVPLDDLILAITGELPQATGDALGGFFDELVQGAENTNSELAALESIGVQTNRLLSGILAAVGGDSGPITDPTDPGFIGPLPPPDDPVGPPAPGGNQNDQVFPPPPTDPVGPPPPTDPGFIGPPNPGEGQITPEIFYPAAAASVSNAQSEATLQILQRIAEGVERDTLTNQEIADGLAAVAGSFSEFEETVERRALTFEPARGGGNRGRS